MKYSKCYAFIWLFSLAGIGINFYTRDVISFMISLTGLICSQAFYKEAKKEEIKEERFKKNQNC